jgi:hypothetical protein
MSGETGTSTPPPPILRRSFEGDKIKGLLTRADCDDKGMTLTIKSDAKTVKLNTAAPERVQFTTYTPDVTGQTTCGPINPPKQVIVTYRASTDARSGFDGKPIAVEFVKLDQK